MNRVITITVGLLCMATYAGAQSATTQPTVAPQNRPLADVARQEEARRKSIRKPAKVYTNNSLRAEPGAPAAPVSTGTTSNAPANDAPAPTAGAPEVELPGGSESPEPARGQAYWQNRIKAAREQVSRSQIFADSLQSRINALRTDYVNRDDPAQKAQLARDLNTALAELARVQKELEANTKQITAIEDEARRAGVPPGWLRPGA